MAGHSQFKNIMHRKGAQDKKRAKVFTRLIREITVAAREGLPDPKMNPRLKAAVAAAKAENMPNDNIDRAIKRATGDGDGDAYESIRYEGYGPGGVAIIVEALTDNRNRTAGEVRAAFTKNGGTLGETGSVSFQFERVGMIGYPADTAGAEAMFEAALEAGASDVVSTEDGHEIVCAPDELNVVRETLEEKFGEPNQSELVWKPQNTVPLDGEKAETLFRLMEALDDSDDVQSVSANYEIDEATMERLTA